MKGSTKAPDWKLQKLDQRSNGNFTNTIHTEYIGRVIRYVIRRLIQIETYTGIAMKKQADHINQVINFYSRRSSQGFV